MVNQAVVECYATLSTAFGVSGPYYGPQGHRGADYRRGAGQVIVAYEKCTVVNSDLYSSALGYCIVAKRERDGKYIGWAHVRKGTRPGNGTVLEAGDQVGLVAGFDDAHGSSWSGPHIHTTEGPAQDHIYSGTVSDPNPDIQAARAGTAGGGATPVVNYHWWQLTPEAMLACQQMLNRIKLYGGEDGGTGPEDKDFGKRSVMGMQEYFKRIGKLPGDYEVDGIPHNTDQNAPSNYGYACQEWADMEGKYTAAGGQKDGLPGALTSQFMIEQANKVGTSTPTPPTPQPPQPTPIPALPAAPEGFVFFPDLATPQSTFDFAEYKSKGGGWCALKMGGGNASDSPYIAPAFQDQQLRARAQAMRIMKYWFNGAKNGLTPESSADYYAEHCDLKVGEVAAVDVEHETETGTVAWTPAETKRYIIQLRKHFPGIKGLVYGSDSMLDDPAWQVVWDLGWVPWNASWGSNNGDPGTPPTTTAPIMAWQYTSNETVPGNYTGNPKTYGRTDGNLGKDNLFADLGWVVPDPTPTPEPEPEPEPEPTPDNTTVVLKDFLEEVAGLATATAARL